MTTTKILDNQFKLVKFIGQGRFSMVFEVISTSEIDKDKPYVLKRFYLQNPKAVKCALREQRILRRISMADLQQPFLETLFYSFCRSEMPALVLSRASGIDLCDILQYFFPLGVEDALFYTTEIICGLGYLHALKIVHLDIKAENMLLTSTGHVMICDFDCAYDLTYSREPPKSEDYKGTAQFMAPEIANKTVISLAADIWNMGITTARMFSSYIRPNREPGESKFDQVRRGSWKLEKFESMPEPLKYFFCECFRTKPTERPTIEEIKNFRLFKNVSWETSALLSRQPPYLPSQLHPLMEKEKYPFSPWDENILRTVLWKTKPSMEPGDVYKEECFEISRFNTIPRDTELLEEAGMTPEKIHDLFANFDFINENAIQNTNSD